MEANTANRILFELFFIFFQKNFDLIENFIKEAKKCENLEERRIKMFMFMEKCFDENQTSEILKFFHESNAHYYNQNAGYRIEELLVKTAVDKITCMISHSIIKKDDKKIYLKRLSEIDAGLFGNLFQASIAEITAQELRYIICFIANMDVKDISLIFNVEIKSVHKTRYRIRKKFVKNDVFRTIL